MSINTQTTDKAAQSATTTESNEVAYVPSPQRAKLNLLCAELRSLCTDPDTGRTVGTKFLKKYNETLTYGRDIALKHNKLYTTKQGHNGYEWSTSEGVYTITSNRAEGKLYVGFRTWDSIRRTAEVRKAHNTPLFQ